MNYKLRYWSYFTVFCGSWQSWPSPWDFTLYLYTPRQQKLCRYTTAEREQAHFSIDQLEKFKGLCKGFTRGMRFCIRANGDVEPCTTGTMGKGYGNIHDERLVRIINKMRLSPVHQMFAEESFERYLPYFSRRLFGSRFFHPCAFFGIISSIAAGVAHLRSNGELTQSKIDALNLRIAKETGFILP